MTLSKAAMHRWRQSVVPLINDITYFDTAPGYGKGLSEEIMGEALEGVEPVIIATKVPLGAANDVRASLEASLRRLRRPKVDLLQIHGNSLTTETTRQILGRGGMLEQMVKLREEGLTSAIGFTSEDNNRGIYDLMESNGFDTMQIAYNFLLQHPCEPTRPFGSLFEARKAQIVHDCDAWLHVWHLPEMDPDGQSERQFRLYIGVNSIRSIKPVNRHGSGGHAHDRGSRCECRGLA